MIVGVDFDTYNAYLVGLPYPHPSLSDAPVLEIVKFRPASKTGEAEALAALSVVPTGLQVCKLLYAAEEVWIERGYGASRKADWILGAFFGVIYTTCAKVTTTRPIEARDWKREVSARCGVTTLKGKPGNPNLKKEVAHEYVRQVAQVARHDLTGYDGNALDAYAMSSVARWVREADDEAAVEIVFKHARKLAS